MPKPIFSFKSRSIPRIMIPLTVWTKPKLSPTLPEIAMERHSHGAMPIFACTVRYTPQEQKGTWERISTGFRENLYSVGNGIKNFFIQFIIHIPSIVVFLAMVGILALIVRFIIRMEQKHSQRVQEKRKKQQMQQVQQIQNIQEGKKDAGK